MYGAACDLFEYMAYGVFVHSERVSYIFKREVLGVMVVYIAYYRIDPVEIRALLFRRDPVFKRGGLIYAVYQNKELYQSYQRFRSVRVGGRILVFYHIVYIF